jgi:hypothetical protein
MVNCKINLNEIFSSILFKGFSYECLLPCMLYFIRILEKGRNITYDYQNRLIWSHNSPLVLVGFYHHASNAKFSISHRFFAY